jgi:urea transport system ATP-binding protein
MSEREQITGEQLIPAIPPPATPVPPPMGHAMLWVDDVTVSFDGFRALNHLSLVLDPGELRCIIGANGAGKTTMMDVITGKTRPDSGRVFMDGSSIELTRLSEHEIARWRAARTRACSAAYSRG